MSIVATVTVCCSRPGLCVILLPCHQFSYASGAVAGTTCFITKTRRWKINDIIILNILHLLYKKWFRLFRDASVARVLL